MTGRLLLDENVERVLCHRLRDAGYDVEHVEGVPALGKGSPDVDISAYALESNRVLLTYDDDFVTNVPADDRCEVLYVPDESLTTETVSEIVIRIFTAYDYDEIDGLVYAGPEWL
jgi:predicted nuclease of predicted toxin-antitoxin system